jgi:hypothetical protein
MITPPNDSDYMNRATSPVKELDNKVLAFSISHDDKTVKIYGHFASTQGDKTTFSRHPLRNFNFIELNGRERWVAYNFTRKVYDTFAPIHLERIQTALAQLPDPSSAETFTSGIGVDTDTGGEEPGKVAASVPSSQDTANFKQPSLPEVVRLQQESNRLKDQADTLLRQLEEQMSRQQEQMRQQQEQHREQMEQCKKIIKMLEERERI